MHKGFLAAAAITASLTVSAALASPMHLYTALLTTSYPDSQLPTGFSTAKVSVAKPDKAKKHHVVGEVEVDINGPDVYDLVIYAVFPNPADARADLVDAKPSPNAHRVGAVPGFRLPSVWDSGSVTGTNSFGKTVTDGLTGMFVVDGSVIIGAVTTSADNETSGNVPAALALLKSGIRHLQRIESRLRH